MVRAAHLLVAIAVLVGLVYAAPYCPETIAPSASERKSDGHPIDQDDADMKVAAQTCWCEGNSDMQANKGERYYCYQFTVPHDFKPRVTVTHTRFRRVFTVKSYSPPSPTPVVRRPVSPPRRIVPRPSPPKDLEPPVVADANPVSPPSGSALGAGSPATVDDSDSDEPVTPGVHHTPYVVSSTSDEGGLVCGMMILVIAAPLLLILSIVGCVACCVCANKRARQDEEQNFMTQHNMMMHQQQAMPMGQQQPMMGHPMYGAVPQPAFQQQQPQAGGVPALPESCASGAAPAPTGDVPSAQAQIV